MILVGLTGGIGSGKSTVSAALERRGAVVIDADAITRELQEPPSPVFDAIVERFGQQVVASDGRLDRAALAAVVFSDPEEKRALEAIVHPEVGREIAQRIAEVTQREEIVVLDVPLLVETGRDDLAALVVVDVDPEVALERLVHHRGMQEDDVRARMANQAFREDRLARADIVIDNSGSLEELEDQVDRCWEQLRALASPG